jgi:hypothetical protein
MAIRMSDVRKAALESMGIEFPRNYADTVWKLTPEFGTHPSHFYYDGMRFKVLTQAEAEATSKTKARRPHRILVWDWCCCRWQFAGKYAQHCGMVGHKMRREN